MKTTIWVLLGLSCSSLLLAQTRSVVENSIVVNKLLAAHASELNEEEKALVNKGLEKIIRVFHNRGVATPSLNSFGCDLVENKLLNFDTGRVIHDFYSSDNCQEALNNVKLDKMFCDSVDNTLYTIEGKQIYDFSSSENCRDSVESLFRSKMFCDYTDNTLRRTDGGLIYDFSSKEDCLKNLKLK